MQTVLRGLVSDLRRVRRKKQNEKGGGPPVCQLSMTIVTSTANFKSPASVLK